VWSPPFMAATATVTARSAFSRSREPFHGAWAGGSSDGCQGRQPSGLHTLSSFYTLYSFPKTTKYKRTTRISRTSKVP
jgi:hypothetical protein